MGWAAPSHVLGLSLPPPIPNPQGFIGNNRGVGGTREPSPLTPIQNHGKIQCQDDGVLSQFQPVFRM